MKQRTKSDIIYESVPILDEAEQDAIVESLKEQALKQSKTQRLMFFVIYLIVSFWINSSWSINNINLKFNIYFYQFLIIKIDFGINNVVFNGWKDFYRKNKFKIILPNVVFDYLFTIDIEKVFGYFKKIDENSIENESKITHSIYKDELMIDVLKNMKRNY